MDINLKDYYNRYIKSGKWSRILFLAGRYIQSAEFNELQSMQAERLKGIGDAVFSDGDVISGCDVSVDFATARIALGAGRIYLDGEVREVEAASLTIPLDTTLQAGVRLRERILSEREDGSLRDPAVGCPGYQQPGSGRLLVFSEWGLNTDGMEGTFYPVYTVSNGRVVTPKTKSYMDEYMDALARYDRESHGFYIIEGLRVRALAAEPKKQAYSISEGKAHVRGYEVTVPYAVRLVVDEDADVYDVEGEPHTFNPDGGGTMRLDVNHWPIDTVKKTGVTVQRTVTVTHGGYSGCADPLPNTSIVQLVSVKQGTKTYTQGTDFRLIADVVDWSPSGDEPAPGSNYEVVYQYRTVATPAGQDSRGFTVDGLVPGSLVLVDYSYRLPRKDIIVIDQKANVTLVKGVAHRYAPVPPETPPNTIRLALVHQNWDGLPTVVNNATAAVPMTTLEAMRKSIVDLYDLVAIERLKTDALVSAPSAVHGVFVDPFIDDDMRDAGTPQTGAIVGGELMLPLEADVVQFSGSGAVTLDYTSETLLEQTDRTGCMQINPYQAFDPLPAKVVLEPSIDRWADTVTQWASEIMRNVTNGSGSSSSTSRSTAVELLDRTTAEATTMRSRTVVIKASGFGPNENIQGVTFDGVSVTTGIVKADADGKVGGSFVIPEGIPTGTKLLHIRGEHTQGFAAYTGTGTVTTETKRNVTTITTTRWEEYWEPPVDPLAQTFTLSAARHVSAVELYFCKAGISPVRVQIRRTTVGMPNREILAEGELAASEIREGVVCRIRFPHPVPLSANIEYAFVVMTDTADHEIGTAKLGEWDAAKGWVKSQPYAAGVLLSSSNASTWTPHNDMDLWFRLLGAKFDISAPKRVDLGTAEMSGVTDLLPLTEVERPAADADVTFVLSKDGVEAARVQANQLLSLSSALDGAYKVEAELFGLEHFSPVLYSGTQLFMGKLGNTGDYVSRSFPCGTAKKVSVRIEALLPGSSNIRVFVQTGASAWTEATLDGFEEIGDGWRRRTYSAACARAETRVKIVLSGTPAERPKARNLRAVILDA